MHESLPLLTPISALSGHPRLATSPLVVVALFVALTWYLQRSWKVCLGVLLGFLFILNQGYWEETTESLTLVLSSCVVCLGLGVPIGIWAAHRPKVYAAMTPVLDLMQTMPVFAYLVPILILFGFGPTAAVIATLIYATPPMTRITTLSLSRVPSETHDLATMTGCTPRQRLSPRG